MRYLPVLLLTICLPVHRAGAQTTDPVPTGIARSIDSLVQAFNSNDADAVAAVWQTDGVHWSEQEKRQLRGHDQLAQAYKEFFKENSKAKLTIRLQPFRGELSDKVTMEGIASVTKASGEETLSRFVATFVKEGDKWRIMQSQEAPILVPESQLPQLGWLVGRWRDAPSGVTSEFEWVMSGRFLKRSFRMEKDGEAVHEGEQLIGWDAEDGCIRSWNFNGNGGFGEGVWRSDGDGRWVVTIVGKLPDGRRGSMKQVLERIDENSLSIRSFDADIEGESQPNSESVTLKRNAAVNQK